MFALSADVIKGTASADDVAKAVQNAIIPIISDFEASLNKSLLLEDEKASNYFAFDLKELLKGDIEKRYKAYQIALQSNFIKLGLNDVLYDPTKQTIYTPNTNAFTGFGEGIGSAPTDGNATPVADDPEARADNNYIQGKDGKMNGSKPSNGGGGVDKSGKSGTMNGSSKVSALGANKFKIGFTKQNLDDHFGGSHDHSKEYPGWTKKQYAKRALDLIQSPADGKNILGYRIGTSTIVRYDIQNE